MTYQNRPQPYKFSVHLRSVNRTAPWPLDNPNSPISNGRRPKKAPRALRRLPEAPNRYLHPVLPKLPRHPKSPIHNKADPDPPNFPPPDLQSSISARQRLESQQQENKGVQKVSFSPPFPPLPHTQASPIPLTPPPLLNRNSPSSPPPPPSTNSSAPSSCARSAPRPSWPSNPASNSSSARSSGSKGR